MRTIRDAKTMARALKAALEAKHITLSHGESLDIVARQAGLSDWNALSARLKAAEAAEGRRARPPSSWGFLATYPGEFDHGIDRDAPGHGGDAALIRYVHPARGGLYGEPGQAFGTYLQESSAEPYLGRRVAIAARLATRAVSHGATIWARVDGAPGMVLAFDNLKSHPEAGWLLGDSDWVTRRVVLPVPEDAVSLHYGFFLKGTGSVWAAGFTVTALEGDEEPAPVALPARTGRQSRPHNLDFSQTIEEACR